MRSISSPELESSTYYTETILVIAEFQEVVDDRREDVVDPGLWELHYHLLKHMGRLRLHRVLQHVSFNPSLDQCELLLSSKQFDESLH